MHSMCIYIYVYIVCIYIYIYIERERDMREREREKMFIIIVIIISEDLSSARLRTDGPCETNEEMSLCNRANSQPVL